MFTRLTHHRYGLIAVLTLVCLGLFFMLRTALLVNNLPLLDLVALDVPLIYGAGLLHDLAFLSYLLTPLVFYAMWPGERWWSGRINRVLIYAVSLFVIGLITFDLVAEWLFWDEFQVRFNFISVDYLVYRREVTGNISESYPVVPIFSAIGLLSLLLFALSRKAIDASLAAATSPGARRRVGAMLLAVPLAAYFGINSETLGHITGNNYKNELGKNGPYQFFYAFWHNELEYEQFYRTGDVAALSARLKDQVVQSNQRFLSDKPFDISRQVSYADTPKKLNIMMIVVESLSGDYLDSLTGTDHLTPYLDELSRQSLFFTRFYATGNRTVRGMEALTLSIPPTPGQSVIHRPKNENLFSLGNLLRDKGYDAKFIYGGYGYFDNMNYFFSHNGFDVVDRTSFAPDETVFGNIWGVSDEYLFLRAIREADKSHAAGKPFYSFVMTTSNHRPYTFPAGRIDLPSGKWTGAVKYTDYAIHKLIEDARRKPWFDDTLFVIVADHCAGSAGKSDVPLERYHIPLIIYAPKQIQPRRVERMVSQIDVAPTLMGLLNQSYVSRFFGKDVLLQDAIPERALMGTYQKVALFRDNHMAILSPQRAVNIMDYQNPDKPTAVPESGFPDLVQDALSYYQGASYQLHNNLFRHNPGENR